jgi:hypothetical protein
MKKDYLLEMNKRLHVINNKWSLIIALFVSTLICIYFNYSRTGKSGFSNNYLGPYLSASVHYKFGQLFLINIEEVKEFCNLDETQKELKYHFKKEGNVYYNHNPVGYIYFIMLGKLIFGKFFGDAQCVVWLQILTHLIICYLIWIRLNSARLKLLFLIFYFWNPLILYFVSFNFYYFWQVIPCFAFLILWLDKKINLTIIFLILSMPFILCTRPTLLFVVLGFFVYLGFLTKWYWGLLGSVFCFAVFLIIYAPNNKNPWHSAYIGLGAYPNKQGIVLSDESGYKLYENVTNKKLDVKVGGNYYLDTVISEYKSIARKETILIIKNAPIEFIRNAFLNFFQQFSIGYIVAKPFWLNVLISITGIFVFAVGIKFKFYMPVILIILYGLSFVFYFPPIPAYLFGSYLPLFFMLILSIDGSIKNFSTYSKTIFKS